MSFGLTGLFPNYRPRRLRRTAALRRLTRETRLEAGQLVLPLFARNGRKLRQPVASMPGVFQLSPDEAAREAEKAHALGVPAVLLFGIPGAKDEKASGAFARQGIVQQTVRLLKKELPQLLVVTDVCLCEYMSHGHCGIVGGEHGGEVLNDRTLPLLARAALSHAEAGADVVAPSDMMDGRVAAIRRALDQHGFSGTPILSYAAKFASAYYGPFRDAAESPPKFGDRRELPNGRGPMRWRRCAKRPWTSQEGADMVMVKPALAYLDVLHRVKTELGYPTGAYAVSGEYAMIKAAAAQGWIDERAVTLETLLAMRRAGADFIITYSAADAARWLKEG